ncbi:hypothetical protein Leryth_019010 [Lithospermum erythrorhizon]|nr:hypothetical protein Leryth_019010 [Lithospermum erythrorhizon]
MWFSIETSYCNCLFLAVKLTRELQLSTNNIPINFFFFTNSHLSPHLPFSLYFITNSIPTLLLIKHRLVGK